MCDPQGCTLWLADADGHNRRALIRGELASWSLDGKRIAYQAGTLAIYDLAARREFKLPVGRTGRAYWFDQDKKLFFLGRDTTGGSGFRGVAGILDLDSLKFERVAIQISAYEAWKAREWVERVERNEGVIKRRDVVFGTFDVFEEESFVDPRLIQDEWSAIQANMAIWGLKWTVRRTINANVSGLWARARDGCSWQQITSRSIANVRVSPDGGRLLWEEQGVGLVGARVRSVAREQYVSAGVGQTSGLMEGDVVGIFEGVVNPLNNKIVGYGRAKGFGLVTRVQPESVTIRIIGTTELGFAGIGAGDVVSLPWGEAWATLAEAAEPKWDNDGGSRDVTPVWEQFPLFYGTDPVSQSALTKLFKTRADAARTQNLLEGLSKYSSSWTTPEAAEALGRLREKGAATKLREALSADRYEVSPRVAWALGELGDKTAVPILMDYIRKAQLGIEDSPCCSRAVKVLTARRAIEKLQMKGAVEKDGGESELAKEKDVEIARPGRPDRRPEGPSGPLSGQGSPGTASPNPGRIASLPPAGSLARQGAQVRFVNESGSPIRLQISGNSKIDVGGKRWVTIDPGKSDEIPVMIGQQKLRIEKVRTAGPVVLWAGFRREKTVAIAPDTTVQITDDDFK